MHPELAQRTVENAHDRHRVAEWHDLALGPTVSQTFLNGPKHRHVPPALVFSLMDLHGAVNAGVYQPGRMVEPRR